MICPSVNYLFLQFESSAKITQLRLNVRNKGKKAERRRLIKTTFCTCTTHFSMRNEKKKKRFSGRQGNIFVTSSLFLALSLCMGSNVVFPTTRGPRPVDSLMYFGTPHGERRVTKPKTKKLQKPVGK